MTEAADELSSAVIETVGRTVRRSRKRLGMSVQALAEAAGVSFGLISQLERGLGNPSLNSLQRISLALGLGLGQLFVEPSAELVVIAAANRELMPEDADEPVERQVRRELLTPRTARVQVIRSTLPVGFSNEAQPYRHLGTETTLVEHGTLILGRAGRRVELSTGDTATYDCSQPHWWANGHNEPTIVIGVVVPLEQ